METWPEFSSVSPERNRAERGPSRAFVSWIERPPNSAKPSKMTIPELSLKIRSEVKRTRRPGQLIVEPRSMLVAESESAKLFCRGVGARNVESNCRLGLRSVLRHCAVGAGRLRPLVDHAVGISASFFRRRSNPHPRGYIDHRRSARTCGFFCPFCAGGAGAARPARADTKARSDWPLSLRAKSDLHRGHRSHFWSSPFVR